MFIDRSIGTFYRYKFVYTNYTNTYINSTQFAKHQWIQDETGRGVGGGEGRAGGAGLRVG